ncbi:MAG TPA: CAP domain-containing protein [Kofleriaceae bacterium]|jgi:hypothetical protein
MKIGAALALLMVGCASPYVVAPPAPIAAVHAPHAEPARYGLATATPPEHQLFVAINNARVAAGLPALAWSDQVSYIAHTATSSQLDFGELAVADIAVDLATADDVDAAVQAWLGNDRRRAHLLSTNATEIGIGVTATADGRIAATAVTFRVPPKIDDSSFAHDVEAQLESRDRKLDPDLRTIAQAAAAKLAIGWTRAEIAPLVQSRLRGLDARWSKIRNSITRLSDASALEHGDQLVTALLRGDRADDIGVGVAQGPNPAAGDGAIWVVVIYAETPPDEISKREGDYIFSPR